MTVDELTKRVAALEREVTELKKQIQTRSKDDRPWWERCAGRFADDPGFEEMVRLGREYRESLRPKTSRHVDRSQP